MSDQLLFHKFLTLGELLSEIGRLQAIYLLEDGLSEEQEERSSRLTRLVRYYTEKGLLEPVRPGPGKKYPYRTVWQVLFIQLLTKRFGLTHDQIKKVMKSVSRETVERVVRGEERIKLLDEYDPDEIRAGRYAGEQMVELSASSGDSDDTGRPASAEARTGSRKKASRSKRGKASDYLASVKEEFGGQVGPKSRRKTAKQTIIKAGPRATIIVDGAMSAEQRALLGSIKTVIAQALAEKGRTEK